MKTNICSNTDNEDVTKVTIKLSRNGNNKILFDEKDISSVVTSLNFNYDAGDLATLSLKIIPTDIEVISDISRKGILTENIYGEKVIKKTLGFNIFGVESIREIMDIQDVIQGIPKRSR